MPCGGGHYGDLMTGHMVQILSADWVSPEKAIIMHNMDRPVILHIRINNYQAVAESFISRHSRDDTAID